MVIRAEARGCGTQVTCRRGPISLVGLLGKVSVRPGLSGRLPTVPGAGARSSHLGATCVYAKIRSDRGSRLFLFQTELWLHQENSNKYECHSLSRVPLCGPMCCGRQVHLSMGFSRQEHWTGWPCPPPGNLPDPGTTIIVSDF